MLLTFLALVRIAFAADWALVRPGVELGSFPAPIPSQFGDSTISVVRVDPNAVEIRLLEAKSSDGVSRTARAWADESGAIAVINAGMFETDGLTSTGYMKTRRSTNNPAWKATTGPPQMRLRQHGSPPNETSPTRVPPK